MTADDSADGEDGGSRDVSDVDGPDDDDIEIRPAVHDDYDDVVAFTEDTWGEDSDYIPRVFHDWIDEHGDRKLTYVADAGDAIAGLAQGVMLSETEAWGQGMRVNPDFRGRGISRRITERLFDWAREKGAEVFRNMVFSWNEAGLGQSRALGYDPVTEFRWVHPEPVTDPLPDDVRSDVDAAWDFWLSSDANAALDGLVLDMDESWALRELTSGMLERAAEETSLLTVMADEGATAFAFGNRTWERENEEGESETNVEYGVGAWRDVEACERLMTAIAADAGRQDADNVRVLIPEGPWFVSDAARARVEIAENPDFVFAKDLREWD